MNRDTELKVVSRKRNIYLGDVSNDRTLRIRVFTEILHITRYVMWVVNCENVILKSRC